MTLDIGLHEVCVRVGVRYVITKFYRMDSLPNFITHGAPLARFARESSAIMHTDYPKFIGMPAVRTDGRSAVGVRSRGYQIFWDG